MAEEDRPSLEEMVLQAFAPLGTIEDSALRRVLVTSFEYAEAERVHGYHPEESPSPVASDVEYIIDKRAVFNAIIVDGVETGERGSSSMWLVEWLAKEKLELDHALAFTERERRERFAPDSSFAKISASRTMIGEVLPATRLLTLATTGHEQPSLRHLNFALLRVIPPTWLGPSVDDEMMQRLWNDFIQRNVKLYPSEAEGWRRISQGQTHAQPDKRDEAVRTLSDAPALVDSLGRLAFAEVLSARIRDVGAELLANDRNADSSFVLHMDGPWGSGKTSILNFLKTDLEASSPPWLIVEFNAWRNQSRKPPWWPLISQVGRAVRSLKWYEAPKARLTWALWRFQLRWAPILLSVLLVLAFGYFSWSAVSGSQSGSPGIPKAIQEAVNGLLALFALGGLAWTTTRKLSLGSASAAEIYVQSSADPFRRIVRVFERLVRGTSRPVAIFIDDLDRCDSAYVIDLIEGIQTLLRAAPVVYVVAGDRKWICSSFEKRYADFSGDIGSPGRPLGYLFLDKVFQLSTSVPQLSAERQAQFWRHLLKRAESGAGTLSPEELRRMEAEAAKKLKGKTRHEDIQQEIEKTEEGSLERETVQAAAAKQITSAEATEAAKHRLEPLAHLLEPNPRSMKRLVNAYGLNQARAYLEGRDVNVEALVRWTVLELRWPVLADHLSRNWSEIADGTLASASFPENVREVLSDPEVRAVIGREGDLGQLTVETLQPILG